MVDVGDSSDIIVQRNVDVQAAYDPVCVPKSAIPCPPKFSGCGLQSCSLEDIVVPLFELCVIISILLLRLSESVAIVYSRNVLSDIVVEPGVHHEHHAYSGRLSQQSLFCEGVRLQQTILERSDRVLGFLISAIQRREIEV